jgi:hypothetical protein
VKSSSAKHVRSTTSVQLAGARGSLLVSRPGPAIVGLSVGGRSVEDLADALAHELEADFVIQGDLTLFLDARPSAATQMLSSSAAWGAWFRDHRRSLLRVVALVDAAAARSVVEVARGPAGLRDRLEILTDANAFERTQVEALRSVLDSGTWGVMTAPSTDQRA